MRKYHKHFPILVKFLQILLFWSEFSLNFFSQLQKDTYLTWFYVKNSHNYCKGIVTIKCRVLRLLAQTQFYKRHGGSNAIQVRHFHSKYTKNRSIFGKFIAIVCLLKIVIFGRIFIVRKRI